LRCSRTSSVDRVCQLSLVAGDEFILLNGGFLHQRASPIAIGDFYLGKLRLFDLDACAGWMRVSFRTTNNAILDGPVSSDNICAEWETSDDHICTDAAFLSMIAPSIWQFGPMPIGAEQVFGE